MEFILHPWHVLIFALSASPDRERDRAIEYLLVENQVLREKLGNGRILLNDDQRRRPEWGRGAPPECLRDLSGCAMCAPPLMSIEISHDKLAHVP